jgi:hypothetical protein
MEKKRREKKDQNTAWAAPLFPRPISVQRADPSSNSFPRRPKIVISHAARLLLAPSHWWVDPTHQGRLPPASEHSPALRAGSARTSPIHLRFLRILLQLPHPPIFPSPRQANGSRVGWGWPDYRRYRHEPHFPGCCEQITGSP